MKTMFSCTNKKLLYSMLLIMLLGFGLSGCSAVPEPPDITTTNIGQPSPEASIEIFGEVSDNGDIKINSDVLTAIKTRKYEFPEAPTILIYHTHATEAFLQDDNYTYEESSEWRTEDNEKNIVYVGDMLKTQLEALGFNVIHDKTNVEPPELKSAYGRSLELMEKYDDVDIYLDLHRNAADVENVQNNTATIDGKTCARLFFVVGTGVGTYEGEYDVAPDWKANYAFAKSVQEKVSDLAPGIMKPIRTKVGRYNQHMGMCLLAEIGNNANTMQEVLNTLPYFTQALGEVIRFQK